VTDGQTDGRTELRWLRRAIAVPAVARKKRIAYLLKVKVAAIVSGYALLH